MNSFSIIEDGLNNDVHVGESIQFHDVRESLNIFTGDDTYSIAKWVEDLEKMSDIELFINSKRLLARTAALYVRSETGIRSWTTLHNHLLNKFKNQINLADVHRQLTARVKINEENYKQYYVQNDGNSKTRGGGRGCASRLYNFWYSRQ